MNNTITITIPFSFKGKELAPSSKIDLDSVEGFNPSSLCLDVARANGIDLYSYELEVMQSSELVFSDPQGAASKFYKDGCFDFTEYKIEMKDQAIQDVLQLISSDVLGIENLDAHPAQKQALLRAYEAGIQASCGED